MRRILLACLVLAFAFSKSALSASAATPPTLLTATRSSTNLFELFLTYSSKMDGTNAYDPANYVIKLGKTTLNIVDGYAKSNEKLGSSSNVILRVDSPITMGANWVVSANANVTDTNGVAITATDLPVTTVEFLVDSGNFWWYADQGAYGMPNAMFYDNSWAQPDFDPSGGNFGSDFPRPTTFGTSGNFGLDWTLCCWDGVNDVVIPSTTYYFILRDAPKVTGWRPVPPPPPRQRWRHRLGERPRSLPGEHARVGHQPGLHQLRQQLPPWHRAPDHDRDDPLRRLCGWDQLHRRRGSHRPRQHQRRVRLPADAGLYEHAQRPDRLRHPACQHERGGGD